MMMRIRGCVAAFGAFALALQCAADGEIVWSGDVVIPADTIAVCTDHSQLTSLAIPAGSAVRFQTATPPACTITGAGTIVKDSADAWTPTTPIEGFTGDYRIAKGIAYAGTVRHAFGDDTKVATKVTVERGASLVVTAVLQNLFYNTQIHLSGEGALDSDGVTRLGALQMPAIVTTQNWVRNVELDDDATIFTTSGGLWFLNGRLRTNGHKVTVTGGGDLEIFTSDVPSVAGGEIYVAPYAAGKSAKLTLRSWDNTNPTAYIPAGDSPFILAGNSLLDIYCGIKPVNRPLWLSGDNSFVLYTNGKATDLYATNSANWAGPVTFTNETGLSLLSVNNSVGDKYGLRMLVVSGPISGRGSVKTIQGTSNQRVALLAENNTYTGYTCIENTYGSSTLLGYPGSVPKDNYAAVTNARGFVDLAVGDACDRWTLEDAYRFRTEATFNGSSQIRFSSEFTTNGCGPVKVAFADLDGTGISLGSRDNVKFVGDGNETPWNFNWYWGKAVLTGPKPILLGTSCLSYYASASADSEVRIENADVTVDYSGEMLLGSEWGSERQTSRVVVSNSVVRCSDVLKSNHDDNHAGAITLGWYNQSVLEILSGAVLTNRLIVGSYKKDPWDCACINSVYQRDGKVVALGGTAIHRSSGLGLGQSSSHGYYEMTGGLLEGRGNFSVGGYCVGVFAQYGGSVLMTNRLDEAPSATSGFRMASCNGGKAVLYLKGGSFVIRPTGDLSFGTSDQRVESELTLDGSEALLDYGSGRIYAGTGSADDGFYAFNFNAGVCLGGGIELNSKNCEHKTTRFDVNFDGGTYRAGKGVNLFGPTTDNLTKRVQFGARNVVVYKGGMTVDTDGNDCYIASCIRKPTGYGIRAIRLGWSLAKDAWVGSPRVLIDASDCGGASATAFAHYDSTNRCIDAVRVTSPGEYAVPSATAILRYKAGDYPTTVTNLTSESGAIEFAANDQTGAFTKTGAGTLTLTVSNDWGGATCVAGGTLRLAATNAVPAGTAVRITNGATLDLNGQVATVGALAYGPGGGKVLSAENAALPAETALETSVGDILAGRTIALAGDFDGARTTLSISGTWPEDAPDGVYPIATTTGSFVGAPTIEMADLPHGWRLRIRGKSLSVVKIRGAILFLK